MKIILRRDHEKLGSVGALVDVKDGFARNYLIPKGIAYAATDGNMRALEEEKKASVARDIKVRKSAEKIAEDLEKVSITLQMKVGEDEKLFGAVTSQMIAEALKEKGFDLDKKVIELEEPIKALGIYTVDVKLHQGVNGKVKVWVVRE
jgi:large subunit ribosomal protein L9